MSRKAHAVTVCNEIATPDYAPSAEMNATLITAIVQAIAAVASAIVTVWLARLTKQYVIETETLRKAAERNAEPLMIGRIEPFVNRYAQFALTNVGNAPARNVQLRLELASGGLGQWGHHVFEPGRTERFFLPTPNDSSDHDLFNTLAAKDELLTAHISYDIDDGKNKSETEHIRFKDLLKQWDSSGWHLPDSELSELKSVVDRRVNELTKAVEAVGRRVEMLAQDGEPRDRRR